MSDILINIKYIFQFEFKSFFKSKKNIITIIFFMILLLLFTVFSSFSSKSTIREQLNIQKQKYLEMQEGYSSIKSLLDRFSNEENPEYIKLPEGQEEIRVKEINSLKKESILYNNYLEVYENIIENYNQNNIREYLELNIKAVTIEKEILMLSKDNNQQAILMLEKDFEKYNKLLELNVMPIGEFYLNGFNFIKNIFLYGPLIICILVIILAGDSFSKDNKNKTYKLLFNQPISRLEIYLGKILANISSILIALIIPIIIFFIGISIVYGFGSLNYPIETCIGGIWEINSLYTIVLRGLINYIFIIVFIILFTVTFSIFFKSISISIIIPLVIYMQTFFTTGFNTKLYSNPFVLRDITSIVFDYDGIYKNVNLNMLLMITIGYATVIFFLNLIYFCKYKIYK